MDKNNKKRLLLISVVSIVCMIFFVSNLRSENLKMLVNLEGTWRFSVGDNPSWSDINFDAKSWDYVSLPQKWESAGYNDYNGFAWYRKEFKLNEINNKYPLYLVMGYIDDVDEVYLNGKLIGRSGVFPPIVSTSYSLLRKYYLPKEMLNKNGNNVIAVRVYDEYLSGGIYKGPVGIYYDSDNNFLINNLAGDWYFNTKVPNGNLEDKMGRSVYVPGNLESRGYPNLHGAITYTKEFTVDEFDKENLNIVLGYIDGTEQVFLNGKLIGSFEELRDSENRDLRPSQILRSYSIPTELVQNGINEITIVIENNNGKGGIYEGPIGLIYRDNLELLKNAQTKEPANLWEEFFKSFFE